MIQEAKGLIMQGSLFPSIPVSLSLPPHPSTPFTLCLHPFVYFSFILSIYCIRPRVVLFVVKSLT